MTKTLGILGGMGPMATVDFIAKLIRLTPARRDQEHIPLLVHAVPQIPDRSACLLQSGESPLDALLKGINVLVSGGADGIAIPCNTAHYWHPELVRQCPVPIFHMADICADYLQQEQVCNVGLMATDGTLKAGFYPPRLAARGIETQLPTAALQQQIMQGIYAVKSGHTETGSLLLEEAFQQMLDSGAQRVILGCTEIPLALSQTRADLQHRGVDATNLLAAHAVDWSLTSPANQAA